MTDSEAGDCIEDDPEAWLAWLSMVREYGPQFAALAKHVGSKDGAAEILAGTILSRLASQHRIFLHRRGPDSLDAAWAAAEAALPEGWAITGLTLRPKAVRPERYWQATANRPFTRGIGKTGMGDTPAAALLALAARLRSEPIVSEPVR